MKASVPPPAPLAIMTKFYNFNVNSSTLFTMETVDYKEISRFMNLLIIIKYALPMFRELRREDFYRIVCQRVNY